MPPGVRGADFREIRKVTYRIYYQRGWTPLKTIRGVSTAAVSNVVARIYRHWTGKTIVDCLGMYRLDGEHGIYVRKEEV